MPQLETALRKGLSFARKGIRRWKDQLELALQEPAETRSLQVIVGALSDEERTQLRSRARAAEEPVRTNSRPWWGQTQEIRRAHRMLEQELEDFLRRNWSVPASAAGYFFSAEAGAARILALLYGLEAVDLIGIAHGIRAREERALARQGRSKPGRPRTR